MVKFWNIVNTLIREADIIIEVLDARLVEKTRNKEIENKIEKEGKQIIYVITKCDLVEKELLEKEKKKLSPCVFMSATKHYGTIILLKKILQLSKGKNVTVAVLGYPNVGKSSVINALKGKKSAGVSSVPGFTKGKQKVRITRNVQLIDSPGVYSYQENDETNLTMIGSKDPHTIKDPETVAYEILELFLKKNKKNILEQKYEITLQEEESYELLEELALKKKKIKKGETPDTETMARILISDWQRGKLQ